MASKMAQAQAATKSTVKISSKHVDYLSANLDLDTRDATKLLRKNNGDVDVALKQFVLGEDSIGIPELSLEG